jgi:aspartyl-tRNA(Asn)/glutamyl-tRNA(Gln) amidotransferase subunit A
VALCDLTLEQAGGCLRAGETSSVELTRAVLDSIAEFDDQINAYLVTTPERALAAARQADARRASGEEGPLLGVPIAVKDIIHVRGVQTTCGSRILEGFIAPFDATVVEKLEAAGAVLLGKTNTDEFAMGSSTENSAYFTTRNPWNLDRVPGGSSGGSAAAVAAGMAFGALGSDTGGSVRQPAAFCGVVGIKPTYGRVSRYGLVAFASSLDQIGVFGRTVTDAAILLGAIAGHDLRDSTSLAIPTPDYGAELGAMADLRGLRVGVPDEYFVEGMQPEVEAAVQGAIATLQELGADLIPVALPHTEYALPVYYLIAPAEASANLARYDGMRYGLRVPGHDLWDTYEQTRGNGFGPEVVRRIMLGTFALSAGYYDAYYLKAQKARTLIKQDFDTAFEKVDVIAAPVTPSTAFRIGEKVDDPLEMYLSDVLTLSVNLAGICGLSLPCGFDNSGLPIGLQLMGPGLGESSILRVAHVYERATAWHRRRPPLMDSH